MKNGAYLAVENLDHVREFQRTKPIYVNDLDISSFQSKQKLMEMFMTRYESETLESIPTCHCGETHDADKTGLFCPKCGTPVVVPTERPIESTLWLRPPNGVPAAINPIVWTTLTKTFKPDSVSIIDWLCDPKYVPKRETAVIKKLKNLGMKQSYKFFYENFDKIMDILCSGAMFSNRKKDYLRQVRTWITENRECVFPQAIPIPSKLAFIVESIDSYTSADHGMRDALDAVLSIASLNSGITEPNLRTKESRMTRAISMMANFYERQYRATLGPKQGWFRKHIFGSRPAFSARAVISSLSSNHLYNEVHLPWALSISLFELHIENKLLAEGWTSREIKHFVERSMLSYNEKMDSILKAIIEEAPGPGPSVYVQRNPSLKRLSAQHFYLTKVKTDPKINTISLGVLILAGMNADFDGDALNVILSLDDVINAGLSRLDSHLSLLGLQAPYTISPDVALPAPVIATIDEWLRSDDSDSDVLDM